MGKGLLGGVTDALFGSADTSAADAAYAKAQELAERAGKLFEDLDAPEQQELLRQAAYLEDVPEYIAEQLSPSGMSVLAPDAEAVSAQKIALAKLGQIGEGGLTPQEEFERDELMRQIGAGERSRQKAIQQEMAQRGVSDSGLELAARLQSSQSAANRASREGQALEAEKYRRALEGISAAGQMGGQIRSQAFGEGAQKASAADRIAQFNAAQRAAAQQYNLGKQQNIAAQKAGALEKAYGYGMEKAKAQAGALTGQAQLMSQQAAGQQQGALQQWAAGPQLFASGAQLVGDLYTGGAFSATKAAGAAANKAKGGIIDSKKPCAAEGMIVEDEYPEDNSYGDNVAIQTNDGEMVLNKRQQGNLFELLDEGNKARVLDEGEEYAKMEEDAEYDDDQMVEHETQIQDNQSRIDRLEEMMAKLYELRGNNA